MEKEESEGIGPSEMPQPLVQFQDPRELEEGPSDGRGSFRGRSLLLSGRQYCDESPSSSCGQLLG